MEVYVLVSGTKECQDRWRNDLTSQFFPVYKNSKLHYSDDGKLWNRRLLVAPIQLYKVAFNKENLDDVMNVLGTSDYIQDRYSFIKKGINTLRKALGLKKIPRPKNPNPLMQPEQLQKAVGVIPIGIKDDITGDDGVEQI